MFLVSVELSFIKGIFFTLMTCCITKFTVPFCLTAVGVGCRSEKAVTPYTAWAVFTSDFLMSWYPMCIAVVNHLLMEKIKPVYGRFLF